ncbi:hypothetical protein EBT31_04465 [bacterium]|nr:hypothetical protein [bacterium]
MLWSANDSASKRLAGAFTRLRTTARSRLQNPPIPALPDLLRQDISDSNNFVLDKIRFGEVQDFVNQCVQSLAFALSRIDLDYVLAVIALTQGTFASQFLLHNPDTHTK